MDRKIETRLATAADQSAIEALVEAAYGRWVEVIGRKPKPMTADYALAIAANRLDLVHDGDDLVALLETRIEDDCVLIVNIAVRPDRQGQGLGSGLLRHAEQVAREGGRAAIRLYTNGLMAPNIALYTRNGYVEERRERRGPGWVVVHMRKSL